MIGTDGGWVRNFPLGHAYDNPAVREIVGFRYVSRTPRSSPENLLRLRRRLERFRAVPPVRALIGELRAAEERQERGEPPHLADMIVRLMRVTVARNTELEVRSAAEKDASVRELERSATRWWRPSGGARAPWRRRAAVAEVEAALRERAIPVPARPRASRSRSCAATPASSRSTRAFAPGSSGRSRRSAHSIALGRELTDARAARAGRTRRCRRPHSGAAAARGQADPDPALEDRRAGERSRDSRLLGRDGGHAGELHAERLALAVRVDDGQRTVSPGSCAAMASRSCVDGGDVLAVDRDDHVAAELVALAGDDDLRVAALDAGLVGRAAVLDGAHEHALSAGSFSTPATSASTSWSVTPR